MAATCNKAHYKSSYDDDDDDESAPELCPKTMAAVCHFEF